MPPKPCNEAGPLPNLTAMGRTAVCAALERFKSEAPGAPLLAVDATCGNGHDTRFLLEALASRCAGGMCGVLSFDVQQAALNAANALLADIPAAMRECVFFLLRSHAELNDALREHREKHLPVGARPCLAAAMYNLGFLPRSDKQVITRTPTTLASLKQASSALAPGGLLSVHAYGGHPGGLEELDAVSRWCADLPLDKWTVVRYSVCNRARNPESLFLAWKRV